MMPLFLILLTAWGSDAPDEPQKQSDIISFGVASIISPRETYSQYRDFGHYIAEHMGMDIQFVLTKSYHEMNTKIQDGNIHIASICSGAVFEISPKKVHFWLVPVIKDISTYQSYIIVPKDSPVQTFTQLKDKVFVYTEPLSNTGTLYPKFYLIRQQYPVEHFFKETFYSKSHDKSIYLINQDLADGAAVNSIVYDFLRHHDPEKTVNTRIVHKSPPFCAPPIVITSALSKEDAERMNQIILNMHNNPQGNSILKTLGIEAFVNTTHLAFEVFKDMRNTVEAYSKKDSPPIP